MHGLKNYLILLSVLGVCTVPPIVCCGLAQSSDSRGLSLMNNKDAATSIRISLTADKGDAKPGEEIALTAETDRDCYLTVFSLGASGTVTVLWPSRESGWDNRVRARTPVKITGPGAALRIQIDGSQRFEKFVAFAASEQNAIFRDKDFRELPGGEAKAFAGHAMEFAYEMRARLAQIPRDVMWGASELVIRVASRGRTVEPPRAEEPTSPPRASTTSRASGAKSNEQSPSYAIRAFNGRYLSVKDGKLSFGSKEIGPTEIFRFRALKNNKIMIVGHQDLAVTSPGAQGENLDRRQAFDLYPLAGAMAKNSPSDSLLIVSLFGVGFRSADGKYLAAHESGGQEAVFNTCAPDLTTRSGFLTLIPVKGETPQAKGLETPLGWLFRSEEPRERPVVSPGSRLIPKGETHRSIPGRQ